MRQILLDTCVISAYVKAEMPSSEANAFEELIQRAQQGQLTIYGSTVSQEEIAKIPLTYRSSHQRQYETLQRLQAPSTHWIDPSGALSHPDYLALRAVLKDENDARLISHAQTAGVPSFVTLDRQTILRKSNEIQRITGVIVQSPGEYLGTTFGSA